MLEILGDHPSAVIDDDDSLKFGLLVHIIWHEEEALSSLFVSGIGMRNASSISLQILEMFFSFLDDKSAVVGVVVGVSQQHAFEGGERLLRGVGHLDHVHAVGVLGVSQLELVLQSHFISTKYYNLSKNPN